MHKSQTLYTLAADRFKKNQAEIKGIVSRINLKEKVYTPKAIVELSPLERIIGENDLVPVNYLLMALEKAKSVGRVLVKNKLGGLEGYGTGFLIAENILMTNAHVLSDAKTAGFSEIEFNYQMDLAGKLTKSITFSLQPDILFATSPQDKLDYSIVSVAPKSTSGKTLDAYGYLPVSADSPVLSQGQPVSIIQHPNGEPKQMALRNNNVTKIDTPYVIYTTDTLGGSSGSPIFTDAWEVAGLHHSGVPKLNAKGQVMSTDGKVWQEWMGDHKVDWIANEGIAITEIVKDLSKKKWSTKQKPLLKSILG